MSMSTLFEIPLLNQYGQPTDYQIHVGTIRAPFCFLQVMRGEENASAAFHCSLAELCDLVKMELGQRRFCEELHLERNEFSLLLTFPARRR
jgi:hypothetical protein